MDDTHSNKLNVSSSSAIISGTVLISGITSQMPHSAVIIKQNISYITSASSLDGCQWTFAYIADQLLMNLCEKEQALSADICREIFDSSSVNILKYRTEFLRTAHRISVSDYAYFPPFRIDQRDLSTPVLKEILAVDKETQNLIMMDVIGRILRSSNKLLYLEHIQPNRRYLSWKWEEFDFAEAVGCEMSYGNVKEVKAT